MAIKPKIDPCIEADGERFPGPPPWIPYADRVNDTKDVREMRPKQAIKFVHAAIRALHAQDEGEKLAFPPATGDECAIFVGDSLPGAIGVLVCNEAAPPFILATSLAAQGMLRLVNPDTGEYVNLRGDGIAVIHNGAGALSCTASVSGLEGMLTLEKKPFDRLVAACTAITDTFSSSTE